MPSTPQSKEKNRNPDGELFADILQLPAIPQTRPKLAKKRVLGETEVEQPKKRIRKRPRRQPAKVNEIDIDAMLRSTEGGNTPKETSDKENDKKKSKYFKRGAKKSKKTIYVTDCIKSAESDWSDDSSDQEKPLKKVNKTKAKIDSDWSDDSSDEEKIVKKPEPEEPPSTVTSKYLDDGTLEIKVETAPDSKSGKKGRIYWKDNPREWTRRAEKAEIRRVINLAQSVISQTSHKMHLLANVWLGLEWDKLCDCPLVHGKILSILSIKSKTDSKSALKKVITELNQKLHFPTVPARDLKSKMQRFPGTRTFLNPCV